MPRWARSLSTLTEVASYRTQRTEFLRSEAVRLNIPYVGAGERLLLRAAEIKSSLDSNKPVCVLSNLLGESCGRMRAEAVRMFEAGKFVQNQSQTKEGQFFDKKGVYAYALQGTDWEVAPNLLSFTREIALVAPQMFNLMWPECKILRDVFTSKLALTTDNAAYPLHIDNPPGDALDKRKVTLIYYLNPDWQPSHAGQLRAFMGDNDQTPCWDIPPLGDSLIVFWSQSLLHEVLAHNGQGKSNHRYAHTVWLTG
jgi:hypothetical protein